MADVPLPNNNLSRDVNLASTQVTQPVQEDTPLDVSGATIDNSPAAPTGIEDRNGNAIDPLDESSAGPYHARETATATNAQINPGTYGQPATIVADTSGTATLTVGVSNDGASWSEYTISIGGAEGAKEEVSGYAFVRASVDANLNSLEVSAKGV